MALEFRILGPLEVVDGDGAIPLGGAKPRALLLLLLMHAGEVVSADRLIDDLWNGSPPTSAAKVVQGYVSQLRRELPADTIVTRGHGYLLDGKTDAAEFERLLAEASSLEATERTGKLRAALRLWRAESEKHNDLAGISISGLERLQK